MPKSFTKTSMIAIGLALLTASATASDEAEVNRIIKSLAPVAGQTAPDDQRTGKKFEVIVEGRTIHLRPGYSVDVEVFFPFDSAALTLKAREQLHALGQALESGRLRSYRYLVAGHTDAKGSADYNRTLSQHRAHAVRTHLIQHFAISPQRLTAAGFGEDSLRTPEEPFAAINRRVEVTMIAPSGGVVERPIEREEPSLTITIE